jgi:hypothetical protein
MNLPSPFAFRPAQVTFWTTLVYLALVIPLVVIQETVPPAPRTSTPLPGIDLDDAWADLTAITREFHPFNSKFNEDVRVYLLERIEGILNDNGASWMKERMRAGDVYVGPPRGMSLRAACATNSSRRLTAAV